MDLTKTGIYSKDVVEFLVALNNSDKLEDAFNHLAILVTKLRFDAVAYSAIPRSLGQPGMFQPVFLSSKDFSKGFLTHYAEAGFWESDFTIDRIGRGIMSPMHWGKELSGSVMDSGQQDVIRLAQSDYHIRNAITIPTRSDQHVIAGATVISSEPRSQFDSLLANHLSILQYSIFHFHQFVFYRTSTSTVFYQPLLNSFTPAERALISFIASGRPLKQSKEITGISQSRAANILSSLYDRMGVSNAAELCFLVGYHRILDRI